MITQKAGSVVFQNVKKTFGAFTAIPDLSLTIEPGTLVTLLGPSGCGKTTTLRMLAGLEHPSAGKILIGGKDVTMLPANERDVSMVFQSYALFPHMNARDNVAYGLESSGLSKKEAREKADEGLALVGLAGMGHRLPAELSGGQQQRVAVARALVLEPQVLLLDEPLSNLDARLRRKVRTDIRELQQRLGFTAVYVTHDQDEALAVSDRIIVMKDGEVAQSGAPRELYEAPASAFIADFMGEANVVACEVVGIEGEEAQIRVGSLEHRVPAGRAKPGAASLAVRPGAIALSEGRGSGLAGRILHSAYLGDHVEYEVETDVGTFFVVDHTVDRILPPTADASIQFKNRGIAIIDR
jgi:iron(III) transport system ATP-binding protein